MSPDEVKNWAAVSMTDLGAGQFEFERGHDKYDLGFTRLGHLSRINLDRQLGQFEPDRAFVLKMLHGLISKFGAPPENATTIPVFWDFWEPYVTSDGQHLLRKTESLSVAIQGFPGGEQTLSLQLRDQRIERADEARLNAAPIDDAAKRLSF